MQMYDLLEYMNNFSKAFGNVWHYCRDEPNDTITGSESFKFKAKITVEAIVPSKYLSNF